jgi:hypothetical protein
MNIIFLYNSLCSVSYLVVRACAVATSTETAYSGHLTHAGYTIEYVRHQVT